MGILRFLLAISVIAWHTDGIRFPLFNTEKIWYANFIGGNQAVVIFFMLSGFYMALVLNTKYKSNYKLFYANRFWRLWPTYLVSIVLALLIVPHVQTISSIIANTSILTKIYVFFSNLFMLGNDGFWFMHIQPETGVVSYAPAYINEVNNGQYLFLNLPSFTLSIEILFYLMAPFIVKSLRNTLVYLGIGVAYHFWVKLSGHDNVIFNYHFFPSSFLFFGLGILSYQVYSNRELFKSFSSNKMVLLLFVVVVLSYLSLPLPFIFVVSIALLIPYLFELTKHNQTDQLIGKLSYPLYIIHYPILQGLIHRNIERSILGLYTTILSVIAALILYFLMEKPIEKWRSSKINIP